MKPIAKIYLFAAFFCILMSFAYLVSASVKAERGALRDGRGGERVEAMTGGTCNRIVDCALSAEQYCYRRGGVTVAMYNANDPTENACRAICSNGDTGTAECTNENDPGKRPELDPPDCDPEIMGPPDPRCPDPDPGDV